ncbi:MULTISPECIES: hypothetical protein [unclassified Duganella]|uniref:hypothetical protein n=1 Tax=unclassified Duganella TaxID=2636909 RepID=UPI001E3D7DAB|nr:MULTISPECIES: hypothetical protein [unclassified Duganella]
MHFYNIEKLVLSTALGMVVALASAAASAEVVVVVSAKSGVASLTSDQVSQIFLAKSVAFPNGDTATAVDQSDGAARAEFYSRVTGKDPSQLKAYWSQLIFTGKAKPPKAVADSAEVKKQVAGSPNAIGYINKSAVDASVKVVLTP